MGKLSLSLPLLWSSWPRPRAAGAATRSRLPRRPRPPQRIRARRQRRPRRRRKPRRPRSPRSARVSPARVSRSGSQTSPRSSRSLFRSGKGSKTVAAECGLELDRRGQRPRPAKGASEPAQLRDAGGRRCHPVPGRRGERLRNVRSDRRDTRYHDRHQDGALRDLHGGRQLRGRKACGGGARNVGPGELELRDRRLPPPRVAERRGGQHPPPRRSAGGASRASVDRSPRTR